MKVTVFGTRRYVFNVDSGTKNEGITAHYTCQSNNPNVKGLEYGKFSCPVNSPMFGIVDNLKLPAQVDLEFNRFGKVSDLEVL